VIIAMKQVARDAGLNPSRNLMTFGTVIDRKSLASTPYLRTRLVAMDALGGSLLRYRTCAASRRSSSDRQFATIVSGLSEFRFAVEVLNVNKDVALLRFLPHPIRDAVVPSARPLALGRCPVLSVLASRGSALRRFADPLGDAAMI